MNPYMPIDKQNQAEDTMGPEEIGFDELAEEHSKEIDKRYKKREVNFGWYQDDNSIASKIYGKEPVIFTSTIEDGEIIHSEEAYG